MTKLYLFKYGANGFLPPRKVQDVGSDGIILSEKRVVACYGPKDYKLKRFFDKAEDDYKSYTKNLQLQYPNWSFISNLDVPQEAITKIHNEICQDAPILGIKNILVIIFELPASQRRHLGEYLNIETDYFAKDYLSEILYELLKRSEFTKNNIPYKDVIYIPEKFKLNYSFEDIEEALNEYNLFLEDGVFKSIENTLQGYEDEEQTRIKHKIIYDYNNASGLFKLRLKILTENYLSQYSSLNDDDYLFYIRAVLIYFFEQCLIGKKVDSENDITTS
ncbi:hypothetical protein ACFL60_04290 [Candidatus Omnitrophota bacterium]